MQGDYKRLQGEKQERKVKTMQNDLEELKRYLPDYLQRRGVDIGKASRNNTVCPVCGGGVKTGCFHYFPDTQKVKCFSCDFNGDLFDLIAQEKGIDNAAAIQEARRMYGSQTPQQMGGGYNFTQNYTQNTPKTERKEPQEDYSAFFLQAEKANDYQYLKGRGISENTQRRFHVGFVPDWKSPQAIRTTQERGGNPDNLPTSPRCIIPRSRYNYLARDTRSDLNEDQRKFEKQNAGRTSLFNADALKELSDFTLVDTPGFDSGIENHNRALASYLGNGSCFVLVISLEKGVVDNPTLRFVHEISNYSDSLVVLLNKRDKLIDADVQEIQESVRESLEFDGITTDVYCVSKYDEDISSRLTEIISSFNVQYVFDKQAGKMVLVQLEEIKCILEMLLSQNQNISLFDYEKELHQLQQTKKSIQEIFNRKKQEAESDFPEKTEEIKRNIKNALINCADDVISASMNGGAQAAEAVIVETIRPLLLQTFRDYTIEHLDGIVCEMENQISSSTSKDSEIVSSLLVNTTENIKKMVENGTFARKVPDENDMDKIKEEKEDEFNKIYHAVAGVLAIATDVISPWLEIVVVLAPEIIRLAQNLFGESEAEKARKIYISSTVPQILRQMNDSVMNAMKESHSLLMDALNRELEEKIAFVDSSIEETRQRKNETEQKHQNYKAMLERDIAEIVKLENEVKGR